MKGQLLRTIARSQAQVSVGFTADTKRTFACYGRNGRTADFSTKPLSHALHGET